MKKFIKKLLPNNFKQDVKDQLGVPSLSGLLKHLKNIGYKPTIVFDIGAYEGYWALDFLNIFNGATIYMFEAQEKKEVILKERVEANSQLHYAIALLGSEDGLEVDFEENETASHVNFNNKEKNVNTRITKTVDELAKINNFPSPDFLKLDVQGYELEILKGATNILAGAEFCLLEISLIDLGNGCPSLKEVINFMDDRDYIAYDISQFIRRPYDKALWQIDMLFIKKNSFFISEKRWA